MHYPGVCLDADTDGCDDYAVSTDTFGPNDDFNPLDDGTDLDSDGICDAPICFSLIQFVGAAIICIELETIGDHRQCI